LNTKPKNHFCFLVVKDNKKTPLTMLLLNASQNTKAKKGSSVAGPMSRNNLPGHPELQIYCVYHTYFLAFDSSVNRNETENNKARDV